MDMALCLVNGYGILSPVSSVSGVELFVGRDIRENVPQRFAEKRLVEQKYAHILWIMPHGMRHLSDPLGDRLSVSRGRMA
jgi:hypothetical protein